MSLFDRSNLRQKLFVSFIFPFEMRALDRIEADRKEMGVKCLCDQSIADYLSTSIQSPQELVLVVMPMLVQNPISSDIPIDHR